MFDIREWLPKPSEIKPRDVLTQLANLGSIVTAALIIWKILILITVTESPIVVVLSGSMEPGFHRGDILFLYMGKAPIRVGEIVVYKIDDREVPIVHRTIKIHEERSDSPVPPAKILTKGDNNYHHDRSLYAPGQMWLNRKHLIGRVVGFFPYLGMFTIIMKERFFLRGLLLLSLGILAWRSKG